MINLQHNPCITMRISFIDYVNQNKTRDTHKLHYKRSEMPKYRFLSILNTRTEKWPIRFDSNLSFYTVTIIKCNALSREIFETIVVFFSQYMGFNKIVHGNWVFVSVLFFYFPYSVDCTLNEEMNNKLFDLTSCFDQTYHLFTTLNFDKIHIYACNLSFEKQWIFRTNPR